jgi:predicted neuraminidase
MTNTLPVVAARLVLFLCSVFLASSCLAAQAATPSKAVLDLALEPPAVNTRPGPEYSDEARTAGMIIGMDRTPKGRIWGCWTGNGDNPNAYFLLATSDDDGRTWSKPRVVIDPTDPPNAPNRSSLVGNLWTDPTGRLWLFFDQSLGNFDGRAGDWCTVCDNPDADEPVWSKPVRLADGFTLNKPTVLRNGHWLLPISLWDRGKIGSPELKEAHHDLDNQRGAYVYVSADQGRTWTRRGGVSFPNPAFDEHMLVELRDGRVWMLARTADGIAQSYSTDEGQTWSKPELTSLGHPSARFHIRRLASGRLLLVKHGKIGERTRSRSHLQAFLSDDDGQSWRGDLMLDDRTGVSYPDGFQAPDGLIHILYDRNRHTDGEILMAKFREEDILAGQFQSPGSVARLLVNKPGGTTMLKQAEADAKQDRTLVAYDGKKPNSMVCDTTLRELPDGSWILFMLAGGDTEPSPKNYIGVTRSRDQGKTWTPLEPFNVGFPREDKTIGQGPTELMIRDGRCTLFFSTHSHHWKNDWQSWMIHSDDCCQTWSQPQPMPGRLRYRTFVRNHTITRDGRILLPFQHYIGPEDESSKPPLDRPLTNPRNGVLMSSDGGKTWTEHGNIRLTENDRYFGWAENNIVELADGRIAMIIRGDGLGGVLYYAESRDGGRTWPPFAQKTEIRNPGSKATLYPLGGDAVAMLHNPNPKHRSPMALWISFDGMKSWPYRRVLVPESCDGPKGRLNYPDGFVSKDKQYLHFAFDDNRHRAVYYGAKLPPLP